MRGLLVAIVMCGSITLARADASPAKPWTVATHDDPPFQIKNADGTWTGIDIELLRLVAAELGTTIEVHEVPRPAITTGALPDVDIVAALNVSERMNARYELSHAF